MQSVGQGMNYLIDREVTFYEPEGTHRTVWVKNVAITYQDERLSQCRLTFLVSDYDRLEQLARFNLKPEVRSPLTSGEFLPDVEIAIAADFQSDLLSHLAIPTNSEEIGAYFLDLPANHPARLTENWYAVSVTQQQGDKTVGYRTFWDYADWGTINQVVTAGSEVVQAFAHFLNQSLAAIKLEESSKSRLVSEIMVDFFSDDDWDFAVIEADSLLQMAYQGDNGRWTCYARAEDEDEQFIFYSVCPLKVSSDRTLLLAEFLSKANYGLTLGNFELDFNDGEIRYKTSIDVQDDRLTPALIERLVYPNVLTMDRYLPGIVGVINNTLAVDEAISQVESE